MVARREHCLSMWDAHPREHLRRGAIRRPQVGVREAIRGHQRSSEVLTLIHQRTLARLVRGNQRSSKAIRGPHSHPSAHVGEARQRQSVVISGNQSSSEAIRGHQSSSAHVGEARRASGGIRIRVLGAPLSVKVTRHLMREAIRRHRGLEAIRRHQSEERQSDVIRVRRGN